MVNKQSSYVESLCLFFIAKIVKIQLLKSSNKYAARVANDLIASDNGLQFKFSTSTFQRDFTPHGASS